MFDWLDNVNISNGNCVRLSCTVKRLSRV